MLAYLKKIEKIPAAGNSSSKLGKYIARLDKKTMKRFLQIINMDDLAKTIKDMDGKVQIKVFKHLKERSGLLLLEAIEQMSSIEHDEIVESQNKVIAIMSELDDPRRN